MLHLFLPLLAICTGLLVFGACLIFRSLGNIKHQELMIKELKRRQSKIRDFLD